MTATSADFPARTDQVHHARRWLLQQIGADHPVAEQAVLLLSEAFTNGVVHGTDPEVGSQIHVGVENAAHLLRVEVIDAGFGEEPHRPDGFNPDSENGRGIELIELIAKEWGWAKLPDGRKKVFFTLPSL